MTKIISSALVLTGIMLAGLAHAEEGRVSSLLYNCNVSFSAHGESIAVGVGYTNIHGKGELSCYDLLTGVTQRIPLLVEGQGPSVGLKVAGFNLAGAATGIGISKSPRSLLGSYVAVRGTVAVIKGVGATVAVRLASENVSINVAVNGESGLGIGLDGLVINLREDTQALPTAVQSQNLPVVAANPAQQQQQVAQAPTTVQTIEVSPGQPVIIKDSNGQILTVIYLKQTR